MTITAGQGSISSRLAVQAILLYQRYLSPIKGFKCAHRVLHGGDSCSEHGRKLIEAQGVWLGVRLLRRRLLQCRTACQILTDRRESRWMALEIDDVIDDSQSKDRVRPRNETKAFFDPACCNALNACDFVSAIPTQAAGDACVGLSCDGAAGADCAGCEAIGACA